MPREGMVHALYEAHRVLKAEGLLIDLRPTPKHRRVGLGQGKRWRLVGVMREGFEDDRAADQAVGRVLREELFHCETRLTLEIDRAMDSMEDFLKWLDDFIQRGKARSAHAWLVRRLERAQKRQSADAKIVVRGPVRMLVMRKVSTSTFLR